MIRNTRAWVAVLVSVCLAKGVGAKATELGRPADASLGDGGANIISVAPLSALLGQVVVDYERRLTRHVSLLATPYVNFLQLAFPGIAQGTYLATKGAGADFALHIYPTGHALRGLLIGPFVGYAYSYLEVENDAGDPSSVSYVQAIKAGARVGYQWEPARWAAIRLSVGSSYVFAVDVHADGRQAAYAPSSDAHALGGVTPELKFGVGVRF